jgi:D-sedoheptulose 7-phosphate isomerase
LVSRIEAYFDDLATLAGRSEVTAGGAERTFDQLLEWCTAILQPARDADAKILFVGNGGSAAIASHMATDYGKNGGYRTLAFNDPAALTCLSNDLGYEEVFAYPIERHARREDVVVAISSSGCSPNILRAADAATKAGCHILTLSGFEADNPLRQQGDWNVYLPSDSYGFVEIGHLTVLHAVLDAAMGLSWGAANASSVERDHV